MLKNAQLHSPLCLALSTNWNLWTICKTLENVQNDVVHLEIVFGKTSVFGSCIARDPSNKVYSYGTGVLFEVARCLELLIAVSSFICSANTSSQP